jgi:spermidine/putrescine-binding protein
VGSGRPGAATARLRRGSNDHRLERPFYNANKEGKNFKIVWDNQILDSNFWAIPKGAKNVDASIEFIKYSVDPEVLAGITKYLRPGA